MIMKDMIYVVLGIWYCVYKIGGNFNNYIGLLLMVLVMFEDMEIVVLEMGMSVKGEIDFLFCLVNLDVVVIMNIGEFYM